MLAAAVMEDMAGNEATEVCSRFCRLFETHQPALRRLVAAYAANPSDREDLLQDIAAGIWKSLPGFRGESSERTWIYRIAHNIAIRSSSRANLRSSREPSIEPSFDRAARHGSVEDIFAANERRKLLLDAIRGLPLLDRQLITLHLEGLSAAEMEDITGISQGAVATRLTRIRQKLTRAVQGESNAL
jgi:RNA polymerase sigma factor (sigma-70 family)